MNIFRRFYESIHRWIMGRPHEPLPIHRQIRQWAIATGNDRCRISPATHARLQVELMAMQLVIHYDGFESFPCRDIIVDGIRVVPDRSVPDGVIA